MERKFLRDVSDIQTGPFGSQLHEKDYVLSGGTPIVTVEHLGSRHFTTQNLPLVSDADRDRLQKYVAHTGDIVFSRVGSVDRCSFVSPREDGWMFSGRCLRVRPCEMVDGEFLYYYLCQTSIRQYIRDIAVGTTMPSINTSLMGDLPVEYPDLPTQRRIAAVLGALDDKIEVNRKICENLEAQAQALFKAWFVDFEPFGGKRPEGWKMGKLGNVGEIVGGATPSKAKSEYYTDDGISWITPKDISLQGTKFIAKGEIDITEKGFKSASVKLMSRGSVLFSSRAPIGYVAIARNDICTNQGFKSVVPKDGIGTCFIYEFLKLNKQLIEDRASGSTFKEISTAGMRDIPIMVPDVECLKRFETSAWPLFLTQENKESESRALAAMRDALLPKLMSGELAVEKVEVGDACASRTGQGTDVGGKFQKEQMNHG